MHMGVTDTRGYLGAREALKVLGLRMEGGGFSRQPCRSRTAVRGAGNARDGDGGDDAHLWKTGEKRFFSSFTLEPPFFTAFAALAALALASSVGTTGWEGARVRRALVASRGEILETETRSSAATKGDGAPRAATSALSRVGGYVPLAIFAGTTRLKRAVRGV